MMHHPLRYPMSRVRELRIAHGFTAEELARRAGCSQAYIAKLDRGYNRNPGIHIALRIADALMTDVRDVFPSADPHATIDE